MINLSSTIPAAPGGGTNVIFQNDVSGNVSAYYRKKKNTATSSAGVLTLDASTGDSFLINVTQAITSMSITNPTDGQEITLLWAQDATGHAVTLATNLIGATAISTVASKHTCQRFTYNVGDTNWYACNLGVSGM